MIIIHSNSYKHNSNINHNMHPISIYDKRTFLTRAEEEGGGGARKGLVHQGIV